MNYQKILLFLGLSFAISLVGLFIPGFILEDDSMFLGLAELIAYSWGPGLAAILVHKVAYGGSMARFGWNRKHYSLRWIGLTIFLPVGIVVGTLGMILGLGNGLGIPGFGEVILNVGQEVELATLSSAQLASLSFGFIQIPPEIGSIFLILVVVSLIGGATFNLLYMSGQELGWRGFMLTELRPMGFLGSNVVIGVLAGLWQLPLLVYAAPSILGLTGSYMETWSVVSGIMTVIGFSVAASFVASWLAIRSRSIYASATFLGVLGNIAGFTFFFTYDVNPYIGSVTGFAGMLVLLLVTFLIIRFDKKMTDGYDKWVY